MSLTFLLVCFVSLKESTCDTRENVFYFSFRSWDNQILTFEVYSNVMTSPNAQTWNTKHILLNNLGSKHSVVITNITGTFRELVPNNTKYFSKHQTILTFAESYWQTILHIFPNIKKYWHFQWVTVKQYYTLFQTSRNIDIFRESIPNSTTHFSKHKQYWYFPRVTAKQCYTLSQTPRNTDIFRELLPNNTTHFSKHQEILTFSES